MFNTEEITTNEFLEGCTLQSENSIKETEINQNQNIVTVITQRVNAHGDVSSMTVNEECAKVDSI